MGTERRLRGGVRPSKTRLGIHSKVNNLANQTIVVIGVCVKGEGVCGYIYIYIYAAHIYQNNTLHLNNEM